MVPWKLLLSRTHIQSSTLKITNRPWLDIFIDFQIGEPSFLDQDSLTLPNIYNGEKTDLKE